MTAISENSRGDVRGRGIGGLQEDGSEEFEASTVATIRIQRPRLNTKS